jgi:hypothetical protein
MDKLWFRFKLWWWFSFLLIFRRKHKCPLQTNQLVKFQIDRDEEYYPFKNGEHLLFLGEIIEMIGHCVIVNRDGKVFWGYHTDNFVALTDDEI